MRVFFIALLILALFSQRAGAEGGDLPPRGAMYRYAMGRLMLSRGDSKKALQFYRDALKADPSSSFLRSEIAALLPVSYTHLTLPTKA